MRLLKDILHLLFPQRCACCGEKLSVQENVVCSSCMLALPRTGYHRFEESKLDRVFMGHFPFGRAVSFFFYVGESNIKLIHNMKYHGRPEIGRFLGGAYACELLPSGFFNDIDLIVPVPLHWRRRLGRGYNQSYHIAKGVGEVAHIPVDDGVLKRVRYNVSQTTRSRIGRLQNVKDIFKMEHPERIEGKHILIVDDVVTTGSTIISCGKELAKVPGVKVSVLSLAAAGRPALPATEDLSCDPMRIGVPLVE